VVAGTAWTGLGVQFVATYSATPSAVATVWILLRFFTVTTNLGMALLFTGLALGIPAARRPRAIGCAVLCMLLVGITYHFLLRGLLELSGGARLADTLLHVVTPIMVPLYWLVFTPKGYTSRRDPLIWAVYPTLYLPYALGRGLAGDIYAYPFINVSKLGWSQVMVNSVALAVAFVAAGYLLVLLDRQLAKHAERS
jgi:hypothetical protein